jgi:hypothetical protein
MQDRPTDIELIEAVVQFLNEEVTPVIADARLRFRVLIAANVLKIVQRELALGDTPLLAEWQQLAALLNRPTDPPSTPTLELRSSLQVLNRELCARIRAGDADGDWREAVFNHVWNTVTEKLRVANPQYLRGE